MADTTALIEYLENRADDYLRAVGQYDGDSHELEYVREGLDGSKIQQRFDALHANITWSWNPPEDETLETLGEKYATVHLREKVVIVHLVVGEEEGILVGLNPEAALDLNTFVVECLEQVEGAGPPA